MTQVLNVFADEVFILLYSRVDWDEVDTRTVVSFLQTEV